MKPVRIINIHKQLGLIPVYLMGDAPNPEQREAKREEVLRVLTVTANVRRIQAAKVEEIIDAAWGE